MAPSFDCPGCDGTGIIWDETPEPGVPGDQGIYFYCDCGAGEARKRSDARLVDQILTLTIDIDPAA